LNHGLSLRVDLLLGDALDLRGRGLGLHAEQLLDHVAVDLLQGGHLLLQVQVVAFRARETRQRSDHRVVRQVDCLESTEWLECYECLFGVLDPIHVKPELLQLRAGPQARDLPELIVGHI